MTAITVCVPVYNGAAFVMETLQHIAAQEFADFRALISVDRGDDDSLEICRTFAADPRFEVVAQSERLGWVGNCNALIARVDTPMFCLTPHDDLLDPRFLAVMHDALMRDHEVCCAYSDIEMFGGLSGVIAQPGVRGSKQHRLLDVLLNHYPSVAFRGLVRRRDANDRPFLSRGTPNDFAADTAWLVTLASRGHLERIPQLLYKKRYLSSSVHAGWQKGPRAACLSEYAYLIAHCTQLALSETDNVTERHEILVAGRLRASGYTRLPGWGSPRTPLEVAEVATTYASLVPGMPPALERIIEQSEHQVLRDAMQNHEMMGHRANEVGSRSLLQRLFSRLR